MTPFFIFIKIIFNETIKLIIFCILFSSCSAQSDAPEMVIKYELLQEEAVLKLALQKIDNL